MHSTRDTVTRPVGNDGREVMIDHFILSDGCMSFCIPVFLDLVILIFPVTTPMTLA